MSEATTALVATESPAVSPLQQIWLLDQQENGGPMQVTFAAFLIEGRLDIELARNALAQIWSHHEALRCTIKWEETGLRILSTAAAGHCLTTTDTAQTSGVDQSQLVERHLQESGARPIGYVRDSAVRLELLPIGHDSHLLVLNAHPGACDGASAQCVGEEFARAYEAQLSPEASSDPMSPPASTLEPSPSPSQPGTAASGQGRRDSADFWRAELDGLPLQRLGFGDRSGSLPGLASAGSVQQDLPSLASDTLERLAVGLGTDLTSTVQAIFQILLYRHSGIADMPVGELITPSDRGIGSHCNQVVRRARLTESLTFSGLVRQVNERRLACEAHGGFPLIRVLQDCLSSPDRDATPSVVTHARVFRTMFSVCEAPVLRRRFGGLALTQIDRRDAMLTCDLALQVFRIESGLRGRLLYDRRVFSSELAATLLGHVVNLIFAACEGPHLPIGALPMMAEPERRLVIEDWNRTDAPPRHDLCLHQLVEAQARHTPSATAIIHGDDRISYGALEQRANRLARRLVRRGVQPETRVSIHLEPSIDLLVAILGVLKAGGAYHPVAPSTPKPRVRLLVEDLGAALVVSKRIIAEGGTHYPCPLMLIDEQADAIAAESDGVVDVAVDPANLAYVIYTSGSTGKPKGVMVPHRSISNTLQWRQTTLPFKPSDRLLLTLSFAFDASIFQLFQPLLAGATLVIPEADLGGDPVRIIEAVQRHQVTILGLPPSLWRFLLKEPSIEQCATLRLAFCGGEALPADIPVAIQSRLGIALNNMYGPTEAAVEATYWTYVAGAPISLGRPIANMKAYVLDEWLEPVPIGVPGDLYLAGVGLARGYLNDPAVTAQRFLPNPFHPAGGARMYRTGDVCRWLPGGILEYLGRQDYQVKLHGHRIELEEIEAVLQGSPAVRECVVVMREDMPGAKRLVAYIVAESDRETGTDWPREFLAERLPSYMIPASFVFLQALPRGTSGKPDRQALPAPSPAAPHPHAPPVDRSTRPVESFLANLWEQVLGVRGILDDDDFFDLGGSSIQVAILARKIEETLQEFVYTVTFYDAPTIAKLAHYLRVNYSQAVTRLFGASAMDGIVPTRTARIGPEDVEALRRIVRTLPPRPPGALGPKNPPAVFVLSPPRSGSTLLRIMLGGHPSLFSPPELVLLSYNSLRERRAVLSSERDKFWLQGLTRAVMEARGCTEREATEVLDECERRDLSSRGLYGLMQSWLPEGVKLVEKTPHYALDLHTLQRVEEDFSDVRYIHLIRHPSPMISSFEEARLQVFFPPFFTSDHPFNPCQLGELVWDICHQNIRTFLAAIPAERRHEVRFEELVSNPTGTMEKVADFLRLSFHPDMADPYRQGAGTRMSNAHNRYGRMLGDVKFQKHGMIRPEAAQRKQGRFPEDRLGDVTRELAQVLGYRLPPRRPKSLVALARGGTAPPLFCVHPAGGTVSSYRELSRRLGPDQPFYAFGTPLEGEYRGHASVEEMAAAYIEELRQRQPEGPYRLSGWSFGGVVAFEMALQLMATGDKVSRLALFSSYLVRTAVPQPPLMLRDFALEFFNEHGLEMPWGQSDGLGRKAILCEAFERAKQAGVISDAVDFDAFRRVMVRHRNHYRAHVRIGRRYVPNGRIPAMVLFDAQDRSLDGKGPFVDWDPFVGELERHTVPGDHFTMLREPNVTTLAEMLKRFLRREAA